MTTGIYDHELDYAGVEILESKQRKRIKNVKTLCCTEGSFSYCPFSFVIYAQGDAGLFEC